MTSILTNNGAMVALQTLTQINNDLTSVQGEIATGKKVSNSSQNASVWAVTTVMQADVDGFNAISESLSLGQATVSVARNASEKVTELLQDMKTKIVTAQGDNVDRNKIQTDIDELKNQIDSIVSAAQFNGLNLLDGSTQEIEILSSLDRGQNGVESASIKVAAQNLAGGGDQAGNVVDTRIAGDIAASDDRAAAVFSAPAAETFDFSSGTGDATGFTDLVIEVTSDTSGEKTILGTVKLDDRASAEERAQQVAAFINNSGDGRLNAVVNASNGSQVDLTSNSAFDKLDVTMRAASGNTLVNTAASSTKTVDEGLDKIDIKSGDTNNGTITLGGTTGDDLTVTITDADGNTITATQTIAANAADGDVLAAELNAAVLASSDDTFKDLRFSTNGAGVITIENGSLEDLTVETSIAGTAGTTAAFDSGAVGTEGDIAGTGGTGSLWAAGADLRIAKDAADGGLAVGDSFRLSIQKDLNDDGTTSEKEVVNFDYVVQQGDDQNDVMQALEALVKADSRFDDVYIKAVNNSDTSNATGDNTLMRIDSTDKDMAVSFTAMRGGTAGGGLGKLSGLDVRTTESAAQALSDIEDLIQTSIDAAASFGSSENRIKIQSDFVSSLVDSMKSGIGALVDADMEKASARLQALQVQQQLGTQALSIANSSPQNVLSLFR